jgi:hypothetical protein
VLDALVLASRHAFTPHPIINAERAMIPAHQTAIVL